MRVLDTEEGVSDQPRKPLCKKCGKPADHYKHDGRVYGLDAHVFTPKAGGWRKV
jgi:hypothetical protein